ncbi:GT-D fold domain-containing protein [Paenibacillus vini]|uniref:GT-D fold domain-containing protein n=1 Tax=Paenibacillus vini TaxID=1476024 RepID=UPI001FD3713E|nr:GT-D fold domain-containing glycosyltransferase [Paenibacillus vini]
MRNKRISGKSKRVPGGIREPRGQRRKRPGRLLRRYRRRRSLNGGLLRSRNSSRIKRQVRPEKMAALDLKEMQPTEAHDAGHLQNRVEENGQTLNEVQPDPNLSDSYKSGFREGYFEGGEAIVTRLLPPHTILPGVTAEDLIASGIRHLAPGSLLPLLTPSEAASALRDALDSGQPLSLVRLGDGELLTLAHDIVIPTDEARRRGPFLPYAGVELPAYDIREKLAGALRQADIIGVPISRHSSFQGLLFPVLSHYGLDPARLRLASSTVNYELAEEGLMLPLLRGRKVLIAGNRAEGLASVLQREGIEVVGLVTPIRGVYDAEAAVQQASGYSFDIALVAAGIAAVLICTEIASRLGKCALDFGHLANKLESGEQGLR